MTLGDLDTLLAWRNHPDIRKYMYNHNEINAQEHENWFFASSRNKSRHLLIFEVGEKSCGFVSFHSNGDGVSEWGFYVDPLGQKGLGFLLAKTAISYGFNVLRFHKIIGSVLSFNEKSIRLHKRLGFLQESVSTNHGHDQHPQCNSISFFLDR